MVSRIAALLSVVKVATLVAQQNVAHVVKQNEDDAKSEDLPAEFTDVRRDPLCILEVANLDAKI